MEAKSEKQTQSKKYDLVALGGCCIDQIFDVDDIMRMELIDSSGEDKKYIAVEYSSKVNVKKFSTHPGGSAGNVACDVSGIGLKSAIMACIGEDVGGDACLADFKKHHVDTSAVTRNPTPTGHSVILITPWGRDRSILAFKGASDLYCKNDLNEEMLKNTSCFAWTSLTSECALEAMMKGIQIAKASGACIAAAPSISIIKSKKQLTIDMMKMSDFTSMNEEELHALTGEKDIMLGMKVLLTWGLKLVNITLGKEGAYITSQASKKLVKTTPPTIKVRDTTGAGDATMAGVIYGYLKGLPIDEIARIAASLSAIEIESEGVRVGLPEKFADLQAFMDNHPIVQTTFDF